MDYEIQLTEIKRLLNLKFKTITPGDCESISIHINKCVNRHISVTTLKRLFGFATQKYKFSSFTLFTLSQFLNIEYINEAASSARAKESRDQWLIVKNKANDITNETLTVISNDCGIPFESTVSRKFIEEDFKHFQKSDYIFTSVVALAGCGKSVLLSHLVHALFKTPMATYKKSTPLFIRANEFFNDKEANFDVEHRLKTLLCVKTVGNVIDYIQQQHDRFGGQFTIILDDFNELFFSRWTADELFNTLKNLFLSLKYCNNIKVVLSMRTSIWIKFYQRIYHSEFLKSTWFPGSNYYMEGHYNIPKLFEPEVEQLLSKINKTTSFICKPLLIDLLKSPCFIKPYFDLAVGNRDIQLHLNPISYDLISNFIQKNIYKSKYSFENTIILKKIVKLSEFGLAQSFVPKKNLLGDITNFEKAYENMIDNGILVEEMKLYEGQSQPVISFQDDYIFHFFLFVELLEKDLLAISEQHFQLLHQTYSNSPVLMPLLKWSVRFAIRTGNFKSLNSVFNIHLPENQTSKLILFLVEEIRYRSKYNSSIKNLLTESGFHQLMFSEMAKCDPADPNYEYTLSTLTEITSKPPHIAIY